MLSKKTISADGSEVVYYTEYPENSSPVTKIKVNGGTVESHSKTDSFGRKVFDELQLGTGFVSRQFSYHAGKVTDEHKQNGKLKSSPTTNLVSQIVLSNGTTLSYAYDAEEHITSVTEMYEVDGVPVVKVTSYTYDALGQLESEIANGITTKFQYDNYGNIVAKGVADENGDIIDETKIQYTYDEVWKDKLISYNGQTITYDAQGNPISYLGHTLTWEKGRQLKSFDNNTYTYNANGIRTSKTVDGVRHDFVLEGARILKEIWEDNSIVPIYDNEDSVCGIVCNGISYFFLKNLQGDIIAITNGDGETVARYSYDAWGKCSIDFDSTGYIADYNPFRYRGYYLDRETGLYYLNSRYYDANTGRFINADSPEYVSVQGGNLFAYCDNCPTKNADYFGFCYVPTYDEDNATKKSKGFSLWAKILIGIAGIAASVALTVATGGAAFPALVASLKVVVGNIAISVALSGLIGYLTGGSEGLKQGLKEGLADGFMWGGIGTALLAASAAIRFGGKMAVYTSQAVDGTTQYVGITNNLARRAAEHLTQKGIQIKKLMQGLNPKCARAVEQCLIEYYGLMKNGGILINKINSIAKTNPVYAESLKLGWYLLKRAGFKG